MISTQYQAIQHLIKPKFIKMYRLMLFVLLFFINQAHAQRIWLPTPSVDSVAISDFQQTVDGLIVASFGKGIQKTDDLAESWNSLENGLENNLYFSDLISFGDAIYVSARSPFPSQKGGIYKSTDQGETWQIAYDTILHKDVYALTNVGSRLLAGTYLGIYLSDDQGNNWIKIDLDHAIYGSDWIFSMASSGDVVIAGSNDGRIFTSNDQGNNWTVQHLLEEGITITKAYVFNDVFYVSTTGAGVYQSVDGLEWEEVELGLSQGRRNMSIYLKVGDDQYYSASGNIYRNGMLFQEGFNLNFPAVRSFAIHQGVLFAGTFHHGVWKYDIPSNDDLNNNLLHVQPNPSAVSTVQLSYQAIEEGKVRILLVDRLGKPIRTIIDEWQTKGKHQIEVDVSFLQDGNYYFYYQTKDQQLTYNFIIAR